MTYLKTGNDWRLRHLTQSNCSIVARHRFQELEGAGNLYGRGSNRRCVEMRARTHADNQSEADPEYLASEAVSIAEGEQSNWQILLAFLLTSVQNIGLFGMAIVVLVALPSQIRRLDRAISDH